MKVAIIDADLVYRSKHRFPNLACMKISAYWKSRGVDVELKLNYDNLHRYDLVSISKVFMDTEIPGELGDPADKTEDNIETYYKNNFILRMSNVQYGGTGFFYDKAPPLPPEIEHMMPDYRLYDQWIEQQLANGTNKKDLQYYTDYSIGFTTRGCIRQCEFCVNKNYKKCSQHSPIEEFLDESRPYICLLDDNIFACPAWKDIFDSLIATGKRFQYKQGLDERLLTDEKCEYLFNMAKWVGERIFAFDNIKDKDLIVSKLEMFRRHTDKIVKFYVFCGFNHEHPGFYDEEFYRKDIADLFERIKILMEHRCLPYVMRYKDCKVGEYKGIYTTIARWCNQPQFIKSCNIREFANVDLNKSCTASSTNSLEKIRSEFPEIAEKYFDMKWS